MGEYLDRWKQAKKIFETTTKVKKPSEKILGIRVGTGIETALKTVDSAAKAASQPKRTAKDVAAFEKAVLAYVAAKNKYVTTLDTAVKAEPTGADKVAYQKGLAVLKTQLTALESTLKMHVTKAKSGLKGERILDTMARDLMASTQAGVERAEAFIARVRAKPTPETFNADVLTVARDINQNIGNVNKLKAKGYTFDRDEPTNLFEVFRPWAGGQRRVPDTANQAQVLRELGAFEQAVNGVKKWLA